MTSKNQQRRIAGMKLAKAVNMIKGAPVSNYANHLFACWARGEISGEEMKAMLINSHKNPGSTPENP